MTHNNQEKKPNVSFESHVPRPPLKHITTPSKAPALSVSPREKTVRFSLKPSQHQKQTVPANKRRLLHIYDKINYMEDGKINFVFADEITAATARPEWKDSPLKYCIAAAYRNGLFYYNLYWHNDDINVDNDDDENMFISAAIPKASPFTFTRGDTKFPQIIRGNMSSLRLSQYPQRSNIQRRKNSKAKPRKDEKKQDLSAEEINAKVTKEKLANMKKIGAVVEYEIKANGKIWDKRYEKINLRQTATNLYDYKAIWEAENDCNIKNVSVSPNSLTVYSPVRIFQNNLNSKHPDYDKLISIMYNNANSDHPIHRLAIHHIIPSVTINDQKTMLLLAPMEGTRTELILEELDWDVPNPRYQNNQIEIDYIPKNLEWKPLKICMFNVPLSILHNNSLHRIINHKITAALHSTCIIYTVIKAMTNEYNATKIDFEPLITALIRPYKIKLAQIQAINDEMKRNKTDSNAMDEDNKSESSANSDETDINEDIWYDAKLNEANMQYLHITNLIQKHIVSVDDILDTNKLKVRRWCMSTVAALQNETGSDLLIPSWISLSGWFGMIRFVVGEDCVKYIGKPFRTELQFGGKFVYATPMTLESMNPQLVVGSIALDFPPMKIRLGALTKFVLELRSNLVTDLIASAGTCSCGKKHPGHSNCPEKANYIKKRENSINQRCKSGRITQRKKAKELQMMLAIKCIRCGKYGHFYCDCHSPLSICITCYCSLHIRSLNPFICDDAYNLVNLYQNLFDVIVNWPRVKFECISHYKLINSTINDAFMLSDIYKINTEPPSAIPQQILINAQSDRRDAVNYSAATKQNEQSKNKKPGDNDNIDSINPNGNDLQNTSLNTSNDTEIRDFVDADFEEDENEFASMRNELLRIDTDDANRLNDSHPISELQPLNNYLVPTTELSNAPSSFQVIANQQPKSVNNPTNKPSANHIDIVTNNVTNNITDNPSNNKPNDPLNDFDFNFNDQPPKSNAPKGRKPKPPRILHHVQITPKLPRYAQSRSKDSKTFHHSMINAKLEKANSVKRAMNKLPFKNIRSQAKDVRDNGDKNAIPGARTDHDKVAK